MNYLKRLFSWNGYAGRKEYIGFLFGILGIMSLVIYIPCLLGSLFKMEFGDLSFIAIVVLGVLIANIIDFFASARRIRHIGFSPWLAIPVVLLSFVAGIGYMIMAVLCFVPSLKTPKLPADQKSYLATNIIVCIAGFLSPIVMIYGLLFIAKINPNALTVFPAFQQYISENGTDRNTDIDSQDAKNALRSVFHNFVANIKETHKRQE